MRRHLFLGLLAFGIGVLAAGTAVVGQDKVERRPPKSDKTVTVQGTISDETMAGVKIKNVTGKEEIIPPSEIVAIFHGTSPQGLQVKLLPLFSAEAAQKDAVKLLKDYRDLSTTIAAATDVKPVVKRYIEFKICILQAAAAETEDDKDKARSALDNFIKSNANSWQYPLAARSLAKLQLDKPDFEGALRTLTPLAESKTVPAEIKAEAGTMLIDVMFQANKIDDVKTRIDAAMKDAGTSEQQKARYRIYQIGIETQGADVKIEEAMKNLDDAINKATEVSIKALGYNIMGDCYMLKNRKRDAMWSYLWVDVVYSQDRTEHVKAMTKLLEIFRDDKDKEKEQIYKEKLARYR